MSSHSSSDVSIIQMANESSNHSSSDVSTDQMENETPSRARKKFLANAIAEALSRSKYHTRGILLDESDACQTKCNLPLLHSITICWLVLQAIIGTPFLILCYPCIRFLSMPNRIRNIGLYFLLPSAVLILVHIAMFAVSISMLIKLNQIILGVLFAVTAAFDAPWVNFAILAIEAAQYVMLETTEKLDQSVDHRIRIQGTYSNSFLMVLTIMAQTVLIFLNLFYFEYTTSTIYIVNYQRLTFELIMWTLFVENLGLLVSLVANIYIAKESQTCQEYFGFVYPTRLMSDFIPTIMILLRLLRLNEKELSTETVHADPQEGDH